MASPPDRANPAPTARSAGGRCVRRSADRPAREPAPGVRVHDPALAARRRSRWSPTRPASASATAWRWNAARSTICGWLPIRIARHGRHQRPLPLRRRRSPRGPRSARRRRASRRRSSCSPRRPTTPSIAPSAGFACYAASEPPGSARHGHGRARDARKGTGIDAWSNAARETGDAPVVDTERLAPIPRRGAGVPRAPRRRRARICAGRDGVRGERPRGSRPLLPDGDVGPLGHRGADPRLRGQLALVRRHRGPRPGLDLRPLSLRRPRRQGSHDRAGRPDARVARRRLRRRRLLESALRRSPLGGTGRALPDALGAPASAGAVVRASKRDLGWDDPQAFPSGHAMDQVTGRQCALLQQKRRLRVADQVTKRPGRGTERPVLQRDRCRTPGSSKARCRVARRIRRATRRPRTERQGCDAVRLGDHALHGGQIADLDRRERTRRVQPVGAACQHRLHRAGRIAAEGDERIGEATRGPGPFLVLEAGARGGRRRNTECVVSASTSRSGSSSRVLISITAKSISRARSRRRRSSQSRVTTRTRERGWVATNALSASGTIVSVG